LHFWTEILPPPTGATLLTLTKFDESTSCWLRRS